MSVSMGDSNFPLGKNSGSFVTCVNYVYAGHSRFNSAVILIISVVLKFFAGTMRARGHHRARMDRQGNQKN